MDAPIVTITPELLRAMTRDASRLMLLRGSIIRVWVVAGLILVASVVVAVLEHGGNTVWIAVAAVVFVVYLPLRTGRSIGRALPAAFPVGSTVRAEVGPDVLRLRTMRSAADIAMSTFRRIDVGTETVLLRQRASTVSTVLPRAAFTADALETLRGGIHP